MTTEETYEKMRKLVSELREASYNFARRNESAAYYEAVLSKADALLEKAHNLRYAAQVHRYYINQAEVDLANKLVAIARGYVAAVLAARDEYAYKIRYTRLSDECDLIKF